MKSPTIFLPGAAPKAQTTLRIYSDSTPSFLFRSSLMAGRADDAVTQFPIVVSAAYAVPGVGVQTSPAFAAATKFGGETPRGRTPIWDTEAQCCRVNDALERKLFWVVLVLAAAAHSC